MQERKGNALVSSSATVSVVIPTYRRPDALRATLSALAAAEHPASALEVIVVDDDGSGDAAKVIAALDTGSLRVRCLDGSRGGAAAARNRGAASGEGDLLIFCDDDVIVQPDHVERHVAAREAVGDPLVNGVWTLPERTLASFRSTPFGRFRLDLQRAFEAEADGRALGDQRYETPLVSARNLAIRRELFWGLGGFDDAFPWAGAEDQDLSLRARKAGCPLVRDHGIRVLHNEQILTLDQFCTREERSAQTAVVLARKFPAEAGDRPLFAENTRVSRSDGFRVAAKKASKWMLARRIPLSVLHRVTRAAERLRAPEAVVRGLYRRVVGLHIFRGVRSEL